MSGETLGNGRPETPAATDEAWVWDLRGMAREGRRYRPLGPYPRDEAGRFATALNGFVRRNALPGDPPLPEGGPFVVMGRGRRD